MFFFKNKTKQRDKKLLQNNKLREREGERVCVSLFANTWGQEDEKSFRRDRAAFFQKLIFLLPQSTLDRFHDNGIFS